MILQICEYCIEMRIKLQSFITKDDDIQKIYVKSKQLKDLVFGDSRFFMKESKRSSPDNEVD